MRSLTFRIFIISLFLLPVSVLQASDQTFTHAPGSFVVVTGTSTLHDWEMKSENLNSEVVFNVNEEGSPESIESIMVSLTINSLKSDKSGLEKRAYDAMDAKRHPEIVFHTNGSGNLDKRGDKYLVNSRGELTVSGVTRQVNVSATCINGDDQKLVCSGSTKLKMSDFMIDPPVMMLGALRTGDEIIISYNIVYVQ
jgi:polyisoprenoid-binding protein YceI